jgi:hypothetical protein
MAAMTSACSAADRGRTIGAGASTVQVSPRSSMAEDGASSISAAACCTAAPVSAGRGVSVLERVHGGLQVVLGDLLFGDLGHLEDEIDDLVLEERRADLLLRAGVLLHELEEGALLPGYWRACAMIAWDISASETWISFFWPSSASRSPASPGARPASRAPRWARSRGDRGPPPRGFPRARAGGRSARPRPRPARAAARSSPSRPARPEACASSPRARRRRYSACSRSVIWPFSARDPRRRTSWPSRRRSRRGRASSPLSR